MIYFFILILPLVNADFQGYIYFNNVPKNINLSITSYIGKDLKYFDKLMCKSNSSDHGVRLIRFDHIDKAENFYYKIHECFNSIKNDWVNDYRECPFQPYVRIIKTLYQNKLYLLECLYYDKIYAVEVIWEKIDHPDLFNYMPNVHSLHQVYYPQLVIGCLSSVFQSEAELVLFNIDNIMEMGDFDVEDWRITLNYINNHDGQTCSTITNITLGCRINKTLIFTPYYTDCYDVDYYVINEQMRQFPFIKFKNLKLTDLTKPHLIEYGFRIGCTIKLPFQDGYIPRSVLQSVFKLESLNNKDPIFNDFNNLTYNAETKLTCTLVQHYYNNNLTAKYTNLQSDVLIVTKNQINYSYISFNGSDATYDLERYRFYFNTPFICNAINSCVTHARYMYYIPPNNKALSELMNDPRFASPNTESSSPGNPLILNSMMRIDQVFFINFKNYALWCTCNGTNSTPRIVTFFDTPFVKILPVDTINAREFIITPGIKFQCVHDSVRVIQFKCLIGCENIDMFYFTKYFAYNYLYIMPKRIVKQHLTIQIACFGYRSFIDENPIISSLNFTIFASVEVQYPHLLHVVHSQLLCIDLSKSGKFASIVDFVLYKLAIKLLNSNKHEFPPEIWNGINEQAGVDFYNACCEKKDVPICTDNFSNIAINGVYGRFQPYMVPQNFINELFPGSKIVCQACVHYNEYIQDRNHEESCDDSTKLELYENDKKIDIGNHSIVIPAPKVHPLEAAPKSYILNCLYNNVIIARVNIKTLVCDFQSRIEPHLKKLFEIDDLLYCHLYSPRCSIKNIQAYYTLIVYTNQIITYKYKGYEPTLTLKSKHYGNNSMLCIIEATQNNIKKIFEHTKHYIVNFHSNSASLQIVNYRKFLSPGQHIKCTVIPEDYLKLSRYLVIWTHEEGPSILKIHQNHPEKAFITPYPDSKHGIYIYRCSLINSIRDADLIKQSILINFTIFNSLSYPRSIPNLYYSSSMFWIVIIIMFLTYVYFMKSFLTVFLNIAPRTNSLFLEHHTPHIENPD